ncbi:hypothetical protein J2X46_003149 [Nocardioides sp. BE266]|uniref:hypothetical protein n=1 Tax=Nocardioides sp. BE266 TaxID=2817725 RepID=UPI00285A2A7C|nr:hypothetical protein [Nocardioides sp. BE266]MDR7254156.1 hypothetical protein [Nocardioides sp. BE266]
MNRMPDRLLRLLLNGPSVLASLVIYVCVLTSLPDVVALVVLVLLVAAMSMPIAGRAEVIVAQALSWSRPASSEELALWASVETLVDAGGAGCGRVGNRPVLVRRSPTSRAAQVSHAGRAVVVVSPLVLQDLATQQVSAVAVAGEVARSRAEHHVAPCRGTVHGWLVTLPVRVLAVALGPLLGRLFRWQPVVVAWQLRAVIGAICVADGVTHDRLWGGLAAATVVLISYMMSTAKREVSRRTASQAEMVRNAAGLRHGRVLEAGSSPAGVRAPVVIDVAETSPSIAAADRPRLYLVRTE